MQPSNTQSSDQAQATSSDLTEPENFSAAKIPGADKTARAAAAWAELKAGARRSFPCWCVIIEAFAEQVVVLQRGFGVRPIGAGRTPANRAFKKWREANGLGDMFGTDITHALKLVDDLEEIRDWHRGLDEAKQRRFNHPGIIFREFHKWRGDLPAPQKRPEASTDVKALQATVARLQAELKQVRDEAGGTFGAKDTARDVVTVLSGSGWKLSKHREIADRYLKWIKDQEAADRKDAKDSVKPPKAAKPSQPAVGSTFRPAMQEILDLSKRLSPKRAKPERKLSVKEMAARLKAKAAGETEPESALTITPSQEISDTPKPKYPDVEMTEQAAEFEHAGPFVAQLSTWRSGDGMKGRQQCRSLDEAVAFIREAGCGGKIQRPRLGVEADTGLGVLTDVIATVKPTAKAEE
jgi:hypothetical protein